MVAERVEMPIIVKPAFAAFAEEARPRLLAMARRVAPASPAPEREDAVQETLERVYRCYDDIESGLWSFAVATLRNELTDRARAAGRRARPSWLNAVVRSHSGEQQRDVADVAVAREDVRQALLRLPLRQQRVLTLVYMLGFDVKDAAALLQETEPATRSLLQRGREALRQSLQTAPAIICAAGSRLRRVFSTPAPTVAAQNLATVLAFCFAVVHVDGVPLPHQSPLAVEVTSPPPTVDLSVQPPVRHQPAVGAPTPQPTATTSSAPADAVPATPGGRRLPDPISSPPATVCFDKRHPDCNKQVPRGDEVCVTAVQEHARPCAKSQKPVCPLVPTAPGLTCTPDPKATGAPPL